MELAVGEILMSPSSDEQKEKSTLLLNQLKTISAERSEIILKYENSNKQLPKTGICSVDASILYLFLKAQKNGVVLDLSVTTDLSIVSKGVISETDINTLVLDLGENAVIAASTVEMGCILIIFGTENDHLCITIYDNGNRFDQGVIHNIGSKRITTHKDSGGTGIGLITTFEILKKYSASFVIDETIQNERYIKKVAVCFDGCGQKSIRAGVFV